MYKVTLLYRRRDGLCHILSQARTFTEIGALITLHIMRLFFARYEFAQGKIEKDGITLYLI